MDYIYTHIVQGILVRTIAQQKLGQTRITFKRSEV